MKTLKSLLFALSTTFVFSQNCPSLGPDQYLNCGVNSTTLTANFSQCAAGSNPNQTTNYNVTTIPYAPQTNTGTQLFMSDDSQQGPFNIFVFLVKHIPNFMLALMVGFHFQQLNQSPLHQLLYQLM